MYSNAYIFRYAGLMVIVVAALLSSAAMFLKPMQDKNIAIEKMVNIMAAADIQGIDNGQAISRFNEVVKEALVIRPDGEVVQAYTDGDMRDSKAFQLNLKEELYKKSQNEDYELPLYVLDNKGVKTYIIPMQGVGLWGPVWGNVALKDDFNTIVGVNFDHKGETPGLGAEINTDMFESQFIGKKLYDDQGNFTSVKVVKGGASTLPQQMQIHGVDAISGGTITSNGVNDMIKNVLESYDSYFKKHS